MTMDKSDNDLYNINGNGNEDEFFFFFCFPPMNMNTRLTDIRVPHYQSLLSHTDTRSQQNPPL